MTQMQENVEKLSVLLIRYSATSMNSYRSYLNKISDIYNEPSIYIMSQAEIKQNIKTLNRQYAFDEYGSLLDAKIIELAK